MPDHTDQLPLAGIRVLEISEGWMTPMCGKLLVDLGADVVRLRGADEDSVAALGAHESAYAQALLNAGKTVLRLAEESEDRVGAMLARADAVLTDRHLLAGGVAAGRAGGGAVVCELSPFGSTGPLADLVASDLTLQAASAVMATTGEAGGGPTRAGTDLGACVAALYGCIGVIAALIERLRSGQGQVVEVSAYDCLVSTLTQFISRVLGGAPSLSRLGNQGANSAPWNLFESGDGQYVFIIAGSDPTFERLAQLMGRTDLLEDDRFDTHIHRRENRAEVTALVQEWASCHDAAEIVEGLRAVGVPVSLVATPAQVLDDAHFRSRHLLGSVDPGGDGGGELPVAGSPLAIGATWQDGSRRTALDVDAWLAGDRGLGPVPEGPRQAPLTGLTVLDVGTITAGPYCARLLGNLGADVIKVEPPGGELGRHSPPLVEGESVYFHITNNGKRSVCLDLSTPQGRSHLERLAGTADVLVENLAPGGLAKRGLGPRDLTALNPRLVYTSVSGFGHEGAAGGQRAYDTVVQAAAGMMSVTGEAGGRPLKTGISSADVLGAVGGTAATLAALFRRERAGDPASRGGWLDIAMYDVVAWATQMWWPSVFLGATEVERAGNEHRLFTPDGLYQASDGPVAVSCETDAQWVALAGMLAKNGAVAPEWTDLTADERRTRRQEIDQALAKYVAGLTVESLVAVCQAAGVPAAPVLDCADVVAAEHTEARDLITTISRPGRPTIRVTNFPLKLSGTPVGVRGPAPTVDEHGAAVRLES